MEGSGDDPDAIQDPSLDINNETALSRNFPDKNAVATDGDKINSNDSIKENTALANKAIALEASRSILAALDDVSVDLALFKSIFDEITAQHSKIVIDMLNFSERCAADAVTSTEVLTATTTEELDSLFEKIDALQDRSERLLATIIMPLKGIVDEIYHGNSSLPFINNFNTFNSNSNGSNSSNSGGNKKFSSLRSAISRSFDLKTFNDNVDKEDNVKLSSNKGTSLNKGNSGDKPKESVFNNFFGDKNKEKSENLAKDDEKKTEKEDKRKKSSPFSLKKTFASVFFSSSKSAVSSSPDNSNEIDKSDFDDKMLSKYEGIWSRIPTTALMINGENTEIFRQRVNESSRRFETSYQRTLSAKSASHKAKDEDVNRISSRSNSTGSSCGSHGSKGGR